MEDREVLEVDVLIVGGGVAGLSCALALAGEVQRHNLRHPKKRIDEPSVLLIEKGSDVGAHVLSGCVLDTRALDEILPDWRQRERHLAAWVRRLPRAGARSRGNGGAADGDCG